MENLDVESFYEAIKNTLLDKILKIKEENFIEPKMKIGPESNHKVLGEMTKFEKQCFTFLCWSWKNYRTFLYRGDLGKIKKQQQLAEMEFDFSVREASNEECTEKIRLLNLQSYVNELMLNSGLEDLKSQFLTTRGILRETIKGRLGLGRCGNARHYLSAGYQIVIETGINDKLESELSAEAKKIVKELDFISTLVEGRKERDGNSKYSEILCILF